MSQTTTAASPQPPPATAIFNKCLTPQQQGVSPPHLQQYPLIISVSRYNRRESPIPPCNSILLAQGSILQQQGSHTPTTESLQPSPPKSSSLSMISHSNSREYLSSTCNNNREYPAPTYSNSPFFRISHANIISTHAPPATTIKSPQPPSCNCDHFTLSLTL